MTFSFSFLRKHNNKKNKKTDNRGGVYRPFGFGVILYRKAAVEPTLTFTAARNHSYKGAKAEEMDSLSFQLK